MRWSSELVTWAGEYIVEKGLRCLLTRFLKYMLVVYIPERTPIPYGSRNNHGMVESFVRIPLCSCLCVRWLTNHILNSIILSLFAMWDYNRLNKKKIAQCEREGIDESRWADYSEMGSESPLFRYVCQPGTLLKSLIFIPDTQYDDSFRVLWYASMYSTIINATILHERCRLTVSI